MTTRLMFATLATAGVAILSGCGGSLAPGADPAAPGFPIYGTDPITGTFSHADPPPCRGPAQLANTPCPTFANPYPRNETTRGGGRND